MEHAFIGLLGTLVAIIFATQVFGIAAQRLGQPAVLGQLTAGIILGDSLLGVLNPGDPTIQAFAELGVLILLFEIGLHTNLRSLIKVGSSALAVGLVGVAVPFGLGYATAVFFGLEGVTAIICGAALTATSIGISARVLSDLGWLDSDEGRIALGAAVIDDVVGLIILSVVSGLTAGVAITLGAVSAVAATAIGFIVVAILIASRFAPALFRYIESLENAGTLGALGLAFAFFMAWVAASAGSALIIGAFAAGLVLHDTAQRRQIEKSTTTIAHFFVPIFFASVGAQVKIASLADMGVLKIGTSLLIVGIAGKFVAGYAPFWFRGRKALIGVAMIPRGEVGLIFAQMGLATGALDIQLFSAVTAMVMGTTFIAPPLLNRFSRMPDPASPSDQRGGGGIDDLVTGSNHRKP